LLVLVLLGVFTIAIFNIAGVNVTKHISSVHRSIADVTRTVLVWVISIVITIKMGRDKGNSKYEWENLRAAAIVLETVGFLILIFGNLVYN